MEITNQIKAKIFAQYLFSDYKDHNNQIYELTPSSISRFLSGAINITLLIKPLSLITDKDAVALHGIMYPDSLHFEDYEKISNITEWIINNNTDVVKFRHSINGYQYLQSKGYDLPQYLLDGKTLKETGLAIYEIDSIK